MPKEDSGCDAGGLHYVFKDAVKHTNWDVYIRTKFGYVQKSIEVFYEQNNVFRRNVRNLVFTYKSNIEYSC